MLSSRVLLFTSGFVAVAISLHEVAAQGNFTCECAAETDGCDYLNLQCQNGGKFTGSCGEALCPVQASDPEEVPAEPFAGAGWRAIRPLGDSTPQVGCGKDTFECANGLYVDEYGAVAESQFGLTGDWVDWSEVCECPDTHIGSECAQVKSPEINNRDNCPEGFVFDGTALNPLRKETEMECFIRYPFKLTFLFETYVEFKHHRAPMKITMDENGEVSSVNVNINARFAPSGSEAEVCTDMLESKCEYTECETLLVDGQTVVQCAETSCEELEACERCIEAAQCTVVSSCSWFGFKFLFDLFNSEDTTVVGKPTFTMLTKDVSKGELSMEFEALNGGFTALLDCRVGHCFPEADLPETARCPATDKPSILCTEDCYAEEVCGQTGRVISNQTTDVSDVDIALVSTAWVVVVLGFVVSGLVVVRKRSKARSEWIDQVNSSGVGGGGRTSVGSGGSARVKLSANNKVGSMDKLGSSSGAEGVTINDTEAPDAEKVDEQVQLNIENEVEWSMDTEDMDPEAFATIFRRRSLAAERRIGISCLDISYSIPTNTGGYMRSPFASITSKRDILRGVSIAMEPGQLTALIGPSGSGKSTLLDLLVGRPKKGKISGKVVPIFPTVEGCVRATKQLRRSVAYIRQDDCLMPTETVFEAVWFAARMRLGSHVSEKELRLRVLTTLKSLHIDHIAKSRIGSSETGGISGGERRRVATALELVSDPSVLCCDEITSGLDSFSTAVMVKVLRHAAHRRRATVICAIHQPPSQVFNAFDNVVLVSKLGGVAYSGSTDMLMPYLHTLTEFNTMFASAYPSLADNNSSSADEASGDGPGKAVGSVPDMRGVNPAELSLEFVSTISHEMTERVHHYWRKSDQHAVISKRVGEIASNNRGEKGAKVVAEDALKRLPSNHRFLLICERCTRAVLRQPSLMFMQFAVTLGVAALMSVTAGNLERDLQGAQTMTSLTLFYILFFAMMSMSSVGTIATDISVFVREKQAKLYSAHQYVLSKMLCDVLPLRVLPPTAFAVVTYWSMGLWPDLGNFSQYVLALILVNVITTALCFFVTSVCLSVGLSNLVSAALIVWCFVFSGFVILTPVGLALRWTSYFFFAWEIIVGNEFKQGKYLFNPQGVGLELGVEREGTDIIKQLEVDPTRAGLDFALLVAWAVVLVVATFLTLSFRRFPS